MTRKLARDLLVDCLLAEGVDAVFGNPGTTELPLMEALASRGQPAYYLGLQEIVALGMADGYSQAAGRPAVVNLHASPGLGNAMGNLYNAWRTRTPLVVTAGQQDGRFNLEEPLLFSDLVRQAAQYTKWSWEVTRADLISPAVRRAFKEATTPPRGPVFLSLPMDLLGEEVEEVAHRPTRVPAAGLPPPDVVAAAGRALSAARRPVIVAGDQVADRRAVSALVALAEALGAPLFAEPLARTLPFPADHPLFAGYLPPFAPYVRLRLGEADLVLVAGAEAFLLYPPYEPGSPFPAHARVVHLSESAHEVGKVHPVDVGMVGDLGLTLPALLEQLGGTRFDGRRSAVESELEASRARLSEQAAAGAAQSPPTPAAAMNALAPVLRGRVVVDEAVSASGALHTAFPFGPPAERFGHRAGGLGWGLPAAIGVALARPGQQVVSVLGDGSVMYAVQGLWSASHHELPILFVVLDNGGYEIIRAGLRRQGGAAGAAGRYVGMEVSAPSIEWGSVAAAFGLRYASVDRAGDVCEAAGSLLAQAGPALLRVPTATGFRLP